MQITCERQEVAIHNRFILMIIHKSRNYQVYLLKHFTDSLHCTQKHHLSNAFSILNTRIFKSSQKYVNKTLTIRRHLYICYGTVTNTEKMHFFQASPQVDGELSPMEVSPDPLIYSTVFSCYTAWTVDSITVYTVLYIRMPLP